MAKVINRKEVIEFKCNDYNDIVRFIKGGDVELDIKYTGSFDDGYTYLMNFKADEGNTVSLYFSLFENKLPVFKKKLLNQINREYICLMFSTFTLIFNDKYEELIEDNLTKGKNYEKFIIRFKLQSFNYEMKVQTIQQTHLYTIIEMMENLELKEIIKYYDLSSKFELLSVIDLCMEYKDKLRTEDKQYLRERLSYYGYEKEIINDFDNYEYENIYIKTNIYTIMKMLWFKKLTKEDLDNYKEYRYVKYLNYLKKNFLLK